MFSRDEYELIDFGDGRKLERFGGRLLDRPSPAATNQTPQRPARWRRADAVYRRQDAGDGAWTPEWPNDASWPIKHALFELELRPTPFGHLGVFPEHAECWSWLAAQVERRTSPMRVLNLFAYTGAATLAAARVGAEVVHIDAAKNVVAWARRNAELSQLADAPIRWIGEDAQRFVQRELRRGNRYDAIIADPPSYGHGPKGEVWRVDDDLPVLLENCGQLLSDNPAFVLLSCHSPGYGGSRLLQMLQAGLQLKEGAFANGELSLPCDDGRKLAAGAYARWFQTDS